MGVKATAPEYETFSPKWKRCRDVVAGQDAMHTAGVAYLPKLKEEGEDEYKARKLRSDFFNGTWRTIDALGGMAFRKPPTVDVPGAIESYLEDINLAGLSMESLAKECVEETLAIGRIGVLVDHPPRPENVTAITVEVAQQLGLRPTLQLYAAESIRNWKFARINNAWVLSMIVLGETEAVPEDEFEDKLEDRYRVLDLAPVDGGFAYRQRMFMVDKKGNDVLLSEFYPLMNGKPLTFIPFKIIDPNGKGDCVDEPPLIDLVDKNIAHYQVNADLRHGAHYTALPTLFLAGVEDEVGADGKPKKIQIGGSAAVTSRFPEARGEFIEYKGQGLGAIEKMLDRIERQMALLGARMIADETKQAETLGATQIKRAGENSVLAKIVQAVSESLEWCLTVFAQWAGQKGKIVYQINKDFLPAGMDAQTMQALLAAVVAGKISDREYFNQLQRYDVISGDVDFEEHQAEIEIQNPAPVPPTKKPGEVAAA